MLSKFVISVLCLFFVSCGTADSQSLRGVWESQHPQMVAHIYKNSIQIDHQFDDGDSGLYWKGTFSSTLSNGESFRSKPDAKALDFALFGSTAKSKKFTYKNGRLMFQFSILGITKKVVLVKK